MAIIQFNADVPISKAFVKEPAKKTKVQLRHERVMAWIERQRYKEFERFCKDDHKEIENVKAEGFKFEFERK